MSQLSTGSAPSSGNRLSLRQFVKTQQQVQKCEDKSQQDSIIPMTMSQQQQPTGQKLIRNERRYSIKQGRNDINNKQMKLHTLPCEQIQRQKQASEQFLFRSTWQGDVQSMKQEMMMKGCTSPTFATDVMSLTGNNNNINNSYSGLFHANNNTTINDNSQWTHIQQGRNRTNNSNSNTQSRSRSKSKSKSSNLMMQKFIGDSVAKTNNGRKPNGIMVRNDKEMKGIDDNNEMIMGDNFTMDSQQRMLYKITKLQTMNQQLLREKKKIQEKYSKMKQLNSKLQQKLDQQQRTKNNEQQLFQSTKMTNQQLLQKMRSQQFWKFYLRAQKMIKSSIQQQNISNNNNNNQINNVINFMKQLQALREMSSQMRKQNKQLKKTNDDMIQQNEQYKDRLSVQQAQVQEHRLKCVAYESMIKKLRQQLSLQKKELTKLEDIKQLQLTLKQKTTQIVALTKQLSITNQQLQQQRLINSQCQKQRLQIKKKSQQLSQQIISLNKQLSSLKTSYNLLQIEKQQLSANKKELIEKERLKQRVYQLEREIQTVMKSKQQEINKLKLQYENKVGKQIQLKDSKCREMDQKVEKIMTQWRMIQHKNSQLLNNNQQLQIKLQKLAAQNTKLNEKLESISQQMQQMQVQIQSEKRQKLRQLSCELQKLTSRFQEQSLSLLNQQTLIKQLRQQIKQKQQMLRQKDFESNQLRQSLMMEIKQNNSTNDQYQTNLLKQKLKQLQSYVQKLQTKHNQALEMYQTVHNEKVQLQMQLQYNQQQLERYSQQLNAIQQLSNQTIQQRQQQKDTIITHTQCNQINYLLQAIESILRIKQQIIRKILIFCPIQFRQLFVEYIYCGDVIKEKYMKVIEGMFNSSDQNGTGCYQKSDNDNTNYGQQGCQQQDQNMQCQQQQQEYVQQQQQQNYEQYQDYSQPQQQYNSTTILSVNNPTKSLHSISDRKSLHSISDRNNLVSIQTRGQNNNQETIQNKLQQQQEQQIQQLMQEFMRIGDIIEEETNLKRGNFISLKQSQNNIYYCNDQNNNKNNTNNNNNNNNNINNRNNININNNNSSSSHNYYKRNNANNNMRKQLNQSLQSTTPHQKVNRRKAYITKQNYSNNYSNQHYVQQSRQTQRAKLLLGQKKTQRFNSTLGLTNNNRGNLVMNQQQQQRPIYCYDNSKNNRIYEGANTNNSNRPVLEEISQKQYQNSQYTISRPLFHNKGNQSNNKVNNMLPSSLACQQRENGNQQKQFSNRQQRASNQQIRLCDGLLSKHNSNIVNKNNNSKQNNKVNCVQQKLGSNINNGLGLNNNINNNNSYNMNITNGSNRQNMVRISDRIQY